MTAENQSVETPITGKPLVEAAPKDNLEPLPEMNIEAEDVIFTDESAPSETATVSLQQMGSVEIEPDTQPTESDEGHVTTDAVTASDSTELFKDNES